MTSPVQRMKMITRAAKCSHLHVSGRRCAQPVKKVPGLSVLCGLHKRGECAECRSMLQTFKPRKGWS